jgi:hypothetical protein
LSSRNHRSAEILNKLFVLFASEKMVKFWPRDSDLKNYDFVPWRHGANLTTFEFTATTPAM